jgi:hypothetical protein
MKTYQHTQPARAIVRGLTAMGVIFAVASTIIHPFIAGAIVIFVTAYFFRSMTIEISDTELMWFFGSGFTRKRVPMSEVVSVEVVRTSLWNGYGIHYTSRGWLYNVSGYGAVCVTLRNGKRICLGSDEPEVVAEKLAKTLEG